MIYYLFCKNIFIFSYYREDSFRVIIYRYHGGCSVKMARRKKGSDPYDLETHTDQKEVSRLMYNEIQDEDKQEYYNPNGDRYHLYHPFRMIVLGSSGSGKTNFVVHMIGKLGCFNKVIIMCKDTEEELYANFLKKKLGDDCVISDDIRDLPFIGKLDREKKKKKKAPAKKGAGKKGRILPPVYDEIDDEDDDLLDEDGIPTRVQYDPNDQICIVFDDFMLDKKSHPVISEYFLRGRKRNISCIFVSPDYFQVPKGGIRSCADYIVLKKMTSEQDVKRILSQYPNLGLSPAEMIALYDSCQETPGDFFWIDVRTNDPQMRFRSAWNQHFNRETGCWENIN